MSEQRRAASTPVPQSTSSTAAVESRAQQVRRVRIDVQRARAISDGANLATTQPWAAEAIAAKEISAISQQRFFPGNENWQTDNSVGHSVVRAVPASNLIRETMAAPTIDAWPRKQNKISSLSQKPSDAENVPPLMRQLNKLVWEGLRSIGVIVDRCVAEYKKNGAAAATAAGRKQLMHDVTEIFDPAAMNGNSKKSGDEAFSQLSAARLATEVVHRFMDKCLIAEQRAQSDRDELQQNRDEIASDNRHAELVAHELGAAVVRWSIFEQAGAVFSKCFATYEGAISEVMKECADCVDDVLNVLVTEIVALRGRVAEARAEHRKHEHQMREIRRERDEACRERDQANDDARDALQRIAQRDKENKRLGYDVEDRDKTIQRQSDEMDLLSKQYNVQENRIQKLSKQLASAREQIDSLTMQVADLKRNLAQSESVATTCAVETLQLRQQLSSVSTAFQQLRAEGKVASGEPQTMQFVGGSSSSPTTSKPPQANALTRRKSSSGLRREDSGFTAAATSAAASSSSAQQHVVHLLDINEWHESACRAYMAELNARVSLDYFSVEDERYTAAGAFVKDWKMLVQEGLLQQQKQEDESTSNMSPAASLLSTVASVHFPEMKPRNSTGVQVVSIADEACRPFFVGMGEGPNVPSALKYVGKVQNMHFGVQTVVNMIIAFFRDTAENTPKHILVQTLDPVHQHGAVGYGSLTHEEYSKNVRRTLTADQKSLVPARPASASNSQGGQQQQQPFASLASDADTKTLIQLMSHWLSIHLDCNDDATPTLYNLLYASRWHSYTPVCRFFDAAVRFDAPAALWFAITDTINLFKTTLENCVLDVFSVGESSVQEAVKKTFTSSLSTAAVARISVTVHQFFQDVFAQAEQHARDAMAVAAAAGSPPGGSPSSQLQQQQPPSSPRHISAEITLRSIFVSGVEFAKRKHRRLILARTTKETTTCAAIWAADSVDESPIVASIRNECILAWFDLMSELSESVMDRAIVSPEGHVTPYSLANALLFVDPLRPKTSMDKIVKTIFGAEKPRAPRPPSPQDDPALLGSGSFLLDDDDDGATTASILGRPPTGSSAAGSGEAGSSRAGARPGSSSSSTGGMMSPGSGEDLLSLGSNRPDSAVAEREAKKPNADDDDDEPGFNYAERYRVRQYAGGDMMLVNEALTRLRMIPLARYTPASNDTPNE